MGYGREGHSWPQPGSLRVAEGSGTGSLQGLQLGLQEGSPLVPCVDTLKRNGVQ